MRGEPFFPLLFKVFQRSDYLDKTTCCIIVVKTRQPIPVAISPVAFEAETGFMELVLYQQRGLEWRQTAAFRPWFFLGVLFKYMHCYSNALV